MIAEQDIYMYSCDTLTHYLSDSYSGLTGIPHNNDVDVEVLEGDDSRLGDVPLPFNDLSTTDPNAS